MILDSWDKLEEIQLFWNTNVVEPNAEFEHFKLVCQLRSNVIGPLVLLAGDTTNPVILVARRERSSLRPSLGYWRPIELFPNAIVGVHGGMIGDIGSSEASEMLDEIGGLFGRREVDVATIHGVPLDSPILQALERGKRKWTLVHRSAPTPHYSMKLETNPDFLWKRMRSKHRTWLRGREHRLREAAGRDVKWIWWSRFSDLERLFIRLEEVASHTYQRGLGAGFQHDREHIERFALFARHGALRIQTCETPDRVLAFWIGIVFKGTFFSAETGYDPDLGVYEPGTLVFLQTVGNLVREGVRDMNFGLGHADYKKRFADQHYLECDLWLFGKTPRAVAAGVLLKSLESVDRFGRQQVGRLGWVSAVKKRWRARLGSSVIL